MIGLEVTDLQSGYGRIEVLHGIDLRVESGEIVALLGPNGAGKSTTLLTIAGVVEATSGRIMLDGREVEGPVYRRCRTDFALVPEGRSVFPSLTLEQNLQVGGVDADEAFEIFPELKKRSGLRSGLLSGGEQQMVALARAILRRPRVLLLDEVSFGLAPVLCERIYERLRDVVAGADLCVLAVEQHLELAARAATRAYILSEGRIGMAVDTSELLEREQELMKAYFGNA
jgi:branched-chain amino acid transport system ATP-binding protein